MRRPKRPVTRLAVAPAPSCVCLVTRPGAGCSSPKATGSSPSDERHRRRRRPKTVRRRRGRHGHPRLLHPAQPTSGREHRAPSSAPRRSWACPGVPAHGDGVADPLPFAVDLRPGHRRSGYIVVPGGTAPTGGYPILSWAHGTTGFAGICAPSLFTSQGGVGPYLVPGLSDYLKAGFVVAATDYEGLGTPGIHPYLLGASEGRGVLDAARAARRLPGLHTSSTVMIYGHSQGGQAALFAGELAPTYAPDLHIAGVVAAAPATGLSTILGVVTTSVGQSSWSSPSPSPTPGPRPITTSPCRTCSLLPVRVRRSRSSPKDVSARSISAIGTRHLTATSVFQPGAATNPVVIAHAKMNDPGRTKTTGPDVGRPGHGRHHRAAGAHRRLCHPDGLSDRRHGRLSPRHRRHARHRRERVGADHRPVDDRSPRRAAPPRRRAVEAGMWPP